METIISWHNDPDLKARAIAGFKAHREQDTLVKGTYSNFDKGVFKGCAVGCVIKDLDPDGKHANQGNHKRYETVAGIPEWLAYLHDRFFEALPHPQNQQWAQEFLEAIPVGKDLKPVYHKFMIWLLSDAKHGTIQYCDEAGRVATEAVIELHKRVLRGDEVTKAEFDTAASHAAAAAYASAADAADAYAAFAAADAAFASAAAAYASAARAARASAARAADASAARAADASAARAAAQSKWLIGTLKQH